MAEEKSISARISDLAEQILQHKKNCYAGQPEVSDHACDRLEDELEKLFPDHPVLKYVGSDVIEDSDVSQKITKFISIL